MAKARRTTHRSSTGKKLYAARDSEGQFKDIQTYARAHGADVRRKSKAETAKGAKKKAAPKKKVAAKPMTKAAAKPKAKPAAKAKKK
jgi:hypothetical protein